MRDDNTFVLSSLMVMEKPFTLIIMLLLSSFSLQIYTVHPLEFAHREKLFFFANEKYDKIVLTKII